ncbi:metallophosphoesterase [Tenacibaculum tangerinum]|uniref:Metallophosphoesterase n=1 Tax=Tenacibaculum tangerinum TaxID=3038772 RepID=A0ABY8L5U9_9FLAO|nr:metallophosphoesterase [Tenacibaculum tangerinum]WGH75305.1 metallophosphoesterase [Tenacibaculum tangerinum]
MKTFVIGDIHGGLKAIPQVFKKANVSEEDTLIFLGDYVDGWSESAQVIQYLIELAKNQRCIFIKGNHDIWCEDWLRTGKGEPVWLAHGGEETRQSYDSFSEKEKQEHLAFFQQTKPYYIDAKNRLFIHAGFTSMHGVEKETFKLNYHFDRTLWETALATDKNLPKDSALYPERFTHYSEIYIGHTPTIRYNSLEPMNAINVWNIDTGAAFTGPLTIMDIDTKEFWQSDPVKSLYPEEKGRN